MRGSGTARRPSTGGTGGSDRPSVAAAPRISGPIQSLFRILVGLLFAIHGAASLFGVLGGVRGTGATVPLGQWPSWWAALIQLVAGGLVLLGVFTRPAAILCSVCVAYAYVTVHALESIWPVANGGETAALFCWSFLAVAVLGAGPWSTDALVARRARERSFATGAGSPPAQALRAAP